MKVFRFTLIAATIGLGSCNGIGEGIKLETLAIVPASNTTTTETIATAKVFRCVRDGLKAYGKFTDGEVGDYTNRGHWSSSDESVVHVSNGDPVLDANPAEENTVFIPGTLTAVGPGTATVTFDYVGLQQTIEVTVADLDASKISITPADTYIAPGSIEALRVTAELDGVVSDITATAVWSFTQPNDALATIGEFTGIVTGVSKTGGTLTAKASFTACDIAPTTTVTVAPIKKLEFQREFTPALTELVVGTSELIKVIASFEGTDKTQDLSTQATLATVPDSFAKFAVSAGLTNELIALAVNSDNSPGLFGVAGFFGPEGYDQIPIVDPSTGQTGFALSTVKATLTSVSIEPKNPQIEPKGTIQFHAIGTYDNGARTQEITRHVGWASDDTSVVAISNTVPVNGFAASLKDEAGSVKISALATAANQVTGDNETTLTVSAPAP
ncbi:MAG TPA: Ig-like domain-containing protein [Nevskiaceae bacterium]|nr:Ig-like domain-containing protein [Nevskiaceae bacterium]